MLNLLVTTAASIGFDRLEYEAIEDAQFANVTIRLSGMISKDIVVHFSTADGSAICEFGVFCHISSANLTTCIYTKCDARNSL